MRRTKGMVVRVEGTALSMKAYLALFVPACLLIPGAVGAELARTAAAAASPAPVPAGLTETEAAAPAQRYQGPERDEYQRILGRLKAQIARQVSIEQRFTIRISPRAPMPPPVAMLNDMADAGGGVRLVERKMGKCVPVDGISSVQYGAANKLVLYMRDRRIVSATLDKGCRAADFYSGFYVAKNDDGMLCVKRDPILSRSGSNCRVEGLRQLVEVPN